MPDGLERLVPDFPEFFRRRSMMPRLLEEAWPQLWGEEHTMRVEEFVESGQHVVRAELPGIDPEKDVDISMSSGMLHIRAERREESKTERRGYRSEFRYGAFSRTLALPADATEKDVKATYHDGILEVRVPMAEKGATTKVPVTRE